MPRCGTMYFLPFVAALICASLVAGKKAPPTALEAKYKARVTSKFSSSLDAVADHIVGRLGLEGGTFSGYELNFAGKPDADDAWRYSCKDVNTDVDSVELCAIRQLHALASICDTDGLLSRNEASRTVILQHLKALNSGVVPTLGIRLKKIQSSDIWFHDKVPGGEVDASPTLQAAALMALVRCAAATDQKQYFSEAENWFVGLKTVFPSTIWNTTRQVYSFHKFGIIWESLALVASYMPKESSFRTSIRAYVEDLEFFLRKVWDETTDAWSFASARALSIRWRSKELKSKKQRKHVASWAQEHVDRFLGRTVAGDENSEVAQGILAKLGGLGYTCGPLQGLTSLALTLPDAELIQVVLKLLEKDVDAYQISKLNSGPWEDKELAQKPPVAMLGGFFRDAQQLKMDKRLSIRVDDAVQCLVALTTASRILENTLGVEIDADGVPEKDGDGNSHSSEL